MGYYWAAIQKEFLLMSRDIHTILVLFVVPMLFILIMSLAMRNAFSEQQSLDIKALIAIQSTSSNSLEFEKQLKKNNSFIWQKVNYNDIKEKMAKDDVLIGIVVNKDFGVSTEQTPKVTLLIDPKITPSLEILLKEEVSQTIMKIEMSDTISKLNPWMTTEEKQELMKDKKLFNEVYVGSKSSNAKKPTSVQQSVPAWLIFSMFFIIIPISNTFINERRSGTLSRLATMNVTASNLLISKALPYMIINQIQLLLMLLVGIFIVPLCGGDRLVINGHFGLLAIVSFVLSIASISYALMISSFVKTTEQAVSIGGFTNIIFAAIGGIMVPLFVMPQFMQDLSILSPMSWGLDAFLGIFLYDASFEKLFIPLVALLLFGLSCFFVAIYKLNMQIKYQD
ncbi:MAG: ABC transporter permease [Sulfurovaceae bacterium]|nr:ABC transporter permease [Sulfurovaceae bacterium]